MTVLPPAVSAGAHRPRRPGDKRQGRLRRTVVGLALALLAPLLMVAVTTAPAAAQLPTDCSMVSDGSGNETTTDNLYAINDLLGAATVVDVGAMTTTTVESLAIRPGFGGYAWDSTDGLVTVDLASGATADAEFDIPGPKVDGLTWANVDNVDSADDILYIIRESGAVEGYTATGGDAGLDVNIGAGDFTVGHDIAWDANAVPPVLYAIRANGDLTEIVTVDANGATLVGASAQDLEGLGFTSDGELIGTSGNSGNTPETVFEINKTTGAASTLGSLGASVDTESIDCLRAVRDTGTVTASAAGSCENVSEGVITATVTHTSGDPVDYDVVVTPAGTSIGNGTVSAAAAVATETTSGDLANGDYAVTVTAGGEPIGVAGSPITIDCITPTATLTAQTMIGDCVDFVSGTVDVDITYVDGNAAGTYTVAWTNAAGNASITGTIVAGTMTESITLVNGPTTITVTNTTGGGDTVILAETVTVDCAPPEPGVISVAIDDTCVANTGTVTITVDHTGGDSPVSYRAEVTGQDITIGTIAADDVAAVLTYEGLADGTYDIAVFDTVADPEAQVAAATVSVVCAVGAPYAVAAVVCAADDTGGTIEFTITNPTSTPAVFVLTVDGAQAGPAIVLADNSVSGAGLTTGLGDGTYAVEALADDESVYTDQLIVDCSPDPVVSIISVECNSVIGNGIDRVVTIEFDNTAVETATEFVVTFGAAMTSYPVASGAVEQVTLDPVAPGMYPLTVESTTGLALLNDMVEIPAPCISADPAGFCSVFNPTEGKIRVEFNNTQDVPQDVRIYAQGGDGLIRDTPPVQGGTPFTIPANLLTNITLTRVLTDGTYEVYVAANGVLIAVEEITLTCQNPIVESTATAQIGAVDCASESVPVTLETSGGNTSVLFEVTLDGAVVSLPNVTPATLTVNANSTEQVNVAGLADTPAGSPGYEIIVTANGVTLDSATVEVQCNLPGSPQAAVGEPTCMAGGFIDVTLQVVGGGASENFIVSLNGNPFPTVTVDGSSTEVLPFGPLPDGVFDVTVTVDGVDVPGSPDSVEIACSTSTANPLCIGTDGAINLTYVNQTTAAVVYVATIVELAETSTESLTPGDSTTITLGGVDDGTYTVTITENGMPAFADTVVVDCKIFGTATATLGDVACVAGATIPVELAVTGGNQDQDFTISVNGVAEPGSPITVGPDETTLAVLGPLADGNYSLIITVDGTTITDLPVNISCATVAITSTCVDGAGQLEFVYTNATATSGIFSTTTVGEVTDNAGAAVAAGATATVTTTTPLPDGLYFITTEVDDAVIDTTGAVIGCTASVIVTDDCQSGDGVIRTIVENSTPAAVEVTIEISNSPTQVAIVEAGLAAMIPRSGRPDGSYLVTVSIDGVVALTQTVLVACDGAGPGGALAAGPQVNHVVSCLAGNGRVDTNIVNTGADTATYRLEFQGLSPRENSVVAGDWWRAPITGRPDGTYLVVVKRAGVVVSTQTLTVACDTDPPAVDTDEISVINACRDGNGYLLFQFVNNTAATKGYVIEFQGVSNRSTSAAAYGASVRAVTGRPDGTYAVSIRSGGATIETLSVTVDCDA